MKKLIINADDFGISQGVNSAIEKCWQKGVITGVSLMAPGDAFQSAVDILKKLGKRDVGVHLALTGRLLPCTRDAGQINSLMQGNSRFSKNYKDFSSAYLLKKIDLKQIFLEFTVQIEKIKEQGFVITHLDSHEHIHMFPGILEVTTSVAEKFNIPYIRLTAEPFSVIRKEFSIKDLARHSVLRTLVPKAKKIISRLDSIKHNNYFWGHFHAERLNNDVLSFIIKNLKNGINELAVHPYEGTRELYSLLNGRWKVLAGLENVRIMSHLEAIDSV